MDDRYKPPPAATRIAQLEAALDAALQRERACEITSREIDEAQRQWRCAVDAVRDPVFMHDRDHRVIRANLAYAERAGMDVREVVGKPYWELFPRLDGPSAPCVAAMDSCEPLEEELRLPSGQVYLVGYYPILDSEGRHASSLHIMRDVTEKRRAEEEQRILSEALRQAAEAVVVLDAQGTIRYINPAFYRLLGYAPDDILGRPISTLEVPDQEESRQPAGVLARLREDGSWHGEVKRLAKDGTAIPILFSGSVLRDADGATTGFVGNYVDLREIRGAEQALREREEQFRAMTTAAQDAMIMLDDAGRIRFWNDAAGRIFGYAAEEALGQEAHRLLSPARYLERQLAAWPGFVTRGEGSVIGKVLEFEARRKDGAEFPIELSVAAVNLRGRRHAVGIVRDITERKRSERALLRASRAQRVLSACNQLMVEAREEDGLLAQMCRSIVDEGGYRLAWIGFVEHDEHQRVRPAAHAGAGAGYLEGLEITWADGEHGRGPTGQAVQMGAPKVVQDIRTDPLYAPWRDRALEHGYAASMALPLREKGGEVFGVLNIYSAERDAFDEEEIRLLEELANDLAFGIRSQRVRRERDHYQAEHLKSASQVKAALVGAIRAMGLILEQRDPYTAGHQVRVAELAASIARELHLSEDRIEGLKLGGMIHDVGKIYVPAEILSRPARLSDIEFDLVKTHPAVGHSVIKDVEFPWPVAEMILQHHERLDGSGYPKGLRGDEIILEARILAVADVVEAISAHRPYRPALGIEAALAEIEAKRGRLFDPDAVDACLRLFREQGYRLDEPSAGSDA